MARRRLPTKTSFDEEAPFYETVSMPQSPLVRNPSKGEFFKKIDTRTTGELNDFSNFLCNVVGRFLVGFLLINGVLFTFFGCGSRFPAQRSITIPVTEDLPVKTVPRINN